MIELRERQKEFVDNCVKALLKRGNTLGVAPTGAGKTIMLSAVVGELAKQIPNFKACVIAHRKELTEQNFDKFSKVNPNISTSIFNADIKSWQGQVTFAMVPTLARKKSLNTIPYLNLLVIDETHHTTAATYKKIIIAAKKLNPNLLLLGVTATPQRGDKNTLGKIFSNCADQILLSELITSGHLVEPETFVVNVAFEKLDALETEKNGEYSESKVAEILDQDVIADEVIRHWQEKANDRMTVVFCSTIAHAEHIAIKFRSYGIAAGLVTGELSKEQRESILHSLATKEIQVIVNVAILTEGWDFPPISCVILLRQSSYKSTMIQMVGRGLRVIDPKIYPGIEKTDCIVLDFGISSRIHGNLEQDIELEKEELSGNEVEQETTQGKQEFKTRECKTCYAEIPKRLKICSFCGAKKEQEIIENPSEVHMKRINMLRSLDVRWVTLEDGSFFTCGFKFFVRIYEQDSKWKVISGKKDGSEDCNETVYLGNEFERASKAANSFMIRNEGPSKVDRITKLCEQEATDKQLKYLSKNHKYVSKGEAIMLLAFRFEVRPQLQQLGIAA